MFCQPFWMVNLPFLHGEIALFFGQIPDFAASALRHVPKPPRLPFSRPMPGRPGPTAALEPCESHNLHTHHGVHGGIACKAGFLPMASGWTWDALNLRMNPGYISGCGVPMYILGSKIRTSAHVHITWIIPSSRESISSSDLRSGQTSLCCNSTFWRTKS